MNKQEIEIAIEIIASDKKAFESVNHGGFTNKIKAFKSAISALEQQLTNGWIPVSEPPSEYGTYMVAWRPINMTETDVKIRTRSKITHFYEILEYDPEDEVGWVETIEQSVGAYEILAWQPLPSVWKGEING